MGLCVCVSACIAGDALRLRLRRVDALRLRRGRGLLWLRVGERLLGELLRDLLPLRGRDLLRLRGGDRLPGERLLEPLLLGDVGMYSGVDQSGDVGEYADLGDPGECVDGEQLSFSI